jgi:hypothetical protein
LFFWDPDSETFVNVFDNDKSVLISIQKKGRWKRRNVILKLFDTNKYAPGPHPFKYGGYTGRQFILQKEGTGPNVFLQVLEQLPSEDRVLGQSLNLQAETPQAV